ncbi:MAG TPA: immunoglobulin domain-containing protein [Phycisphaerales bacterium]|nr:immunoglobulin domain-containing protein [Phycisphaerales bacterium]
MLQFNRFRPLAAAVVCASFGAPAHAQDCSAGTFLRTTGSPGAAIMNGSTLEAGSVRAACAWDPDGAGPEPEGMVVVGRFIEIDGVVAHNIAFFDGSRWHPVGDDSLRFATPTSTPIANGVCIHNGEIVVSGSFRTLVGNANNFNHLARWNGAAWLPVLGQTGQPGLASDLGSGPGVASMCSFDGALIVTGVFRVPGLNIRRIASWNNGVWDGMEFPVSQMDLLHGTQVVDGDLYVAGAAANSSASPMWRYTVGGGWTGLSAGLQLNTGSAQSITSMSVDDTGIYVIGRLRPVDGADGFRIMHWDGAAFQTHAEGVAGSTGAVVRSGGNTYALANGERRVARNVNGVMQPEGPTYALDFGHFGTAPQLLGSFNGRLLLGGTFETLEPTNTPPNPALWSIAWHDPVDPSPVSSGFTDRVSQFVRVGDDVYAVGQFRSAGGRRANYAAKYDGQRWLPVGDGTGLIEDAWCGAAWNGSLVVGGGTTTPYVARWTGTAWEYLGDLPQTCRELAVAGGVLYARVGSYTTPVTGIELLRWNGGEWESVTTQAIQRLVVHNDVLYGTVPYFEPASDGTVYRLDGDELVDIAPDVLWVGLRGVWRDRLVCSGTFWPGWHYMALYDPVTETFERMTGTFPNVVAPALSRQRPDIRTDAEYGGEFILGLGQEEFPFSQEVVLRWNGATWRVMGSFRMYSPSVPTRTSVPFVHGDELWIGHGGVSVRETPGGAFSQGQAHWSRWAGPERPIVVSHPADTTVTAGETATLTQLITPAVSYYRWQRVGSSVTDGPTPWGSIVSGAATPTLTITNAQPEDAGAYSCYVDDGCETFFSPRATLTVVPLCDSIDFNADGLFPDNLDLVDYLSVFGGGPCTNDPNCGDLDFNNDGLFPDNEDIFALFRVFGGGVCN